MTIPMYVVRWSVWINEDDVSATDISMRVPQDQVDRFIRILMMNGISSFYAEAEVTEGG